jgi:PBSX family phage terminase large subunit
MSVKIKVPEKFKILYNLPLNTNFIILIGGRAGMKTYEASKWITIQSTVKEKRCVILRDEKSLIRESILNEILIRYDTANKNGALDRFYEKMETGIKNRETNEMVIFSKGFRASNNAKSANLKSISNVDYAIIEEAEDIRDFDKFSVFSDSIRNEGSIIVLILNTPDINHFIVKRFFNLEQVEDGFFKIIPKDIPGFVCIQTSYEDNPYLPDHVIERYKSYGDPNSHLYNPFYFKTAIKGWASTGRKGQILTKVKPIKLADYLALPFTEIIGQDFGTNHPAGTVGVKFDGDNSYCRQLNYLPLNVKLLAKKYIELGIKDETIIADSAEPFSVGKLRGGWEEGELSEEDIKNYPQLLQGWSVFGVVKAQGSVKTGLDKMDSMNLFAVEESTDLWNEIMNYIWATDANGNQTGEPLKAFDDLIDPWRYVIESRGRYF